jgi:hypothetical protein
MMGWPAVSKLLFCKRQATADVGHTQAHKQYGDFISLLVFSFKEGK